MVLAVFAALPTHGTRGAGPGSPPTGRSSTTPRPTWGPRAASLSCYAARPALRLTPVSDLRKYAAGVACVFICACWSDDGSTIDAGWAPPSDAQTPTDSGVHLDAMAPIDGSRILDLSEEQGGDSQMLDPTLGQPCDDSCLVGECYLGRCVPAGFSYAPAGTFLMGSPGDEPGRVDELEQQHRVTLTRAFFVMQREVTQADFEALMGINPSYFSACGPTCPVEQVTWLDALAYANARSRREGLPECYDLAGCTGSVAGRDLRCSPPMDMSLDCEGYRLPTEAEWEYSYRAGTTTMFHNGEPTEYSLCDQPLLQETSQFCGNCSVTYGQVYDCSQGGSRPSQPTDCGTAPVGSRAPNAWGIYDMAGNAQEIVWDARANYSGHDEVDPVGPVHDGWVRKRGAGFCGHMARLRAADRKYTTWTSTNPGQGFRLVRTALE